MLEDSLSELSEPGTQEKAERKEHTTSNEMPPAAHTLMDLVITVSIYLPRASFASLFSLSARLLPFQADPKLQKKAYKLLPRLASSSTGRIALVERNSELQGLLRDTAASVSASARHDRLLAIAVVVEHLPDSDLHFIPALLSEIVLACKEVNEKTRTAAFELLTTMGQRMSKGGTVQQSKIPHMDASAPDAPATLEEFFTMVAAGLVGNSPHMISASITALSRISYEFREELPQAVLEDLVQTMSVFLTSKNREIVRSVLGFVKVAIVSLSEAVVKPHLEALIPGLIEWSHEHKARFRMKVKNILERVIRRFGYQEVERYCPEEDLKLIQHIRKQRERRKKKKHTDQTDEDRENEDGTKKGRFESEYDQALYGSDSSASSLASGSDSDDALPRMRGKSKAQGAYITETGDEPLDLLDRKTLANISSSKPQPIRRPPTGKNKGKIDSDGKFIINDDAREDGTSDDAHDSMAIDVPGDGNGGINAYVEAVSGKDAVHRGQRGRLKYNTKRTKHDEMDIDGQDDAIKDAGKTTEKRVRFAGKIGKQPVNAGRRSEVGGRANSSRMKPRGGISKRVQRKPLGGGKVNGGRIDKGGMRR